MKLLIASLVMVTLAALAAFPAAGSPPQPVASLLPSTVAGLTLEDALALAFAHNPRLRSAEYRAESLQGRAEQSKAWPNPRLSFSAEEVPDGGSLTDGKTLVGIEQSIPFPLKKSTDGLVGRWEAAQAEAETELVRTALRKDVTIAFAHALAAEKRLDVSQEILDLTAALAEGAASRVEAGAAPYQEQLRAELELERRRADLSALESERAAAREALFVLLGTPASGAALAGDLAADSVFVSPRPPEGRSLPLHPAAAGASAARKRAEAEYGRAQLELLPDFEFAFAAGRDDADQDVYEFEAALSIPIFDRSGGLRREKRAGLEAARSELSAIEAELDAARRSAEASLDAALQSALAYRDRVLPRADEALVLVRGGFEAGKFGFLDLLDTQRTAADARLAYVDRLLELNIARAELAALAAGTAAARQE